MNQIDAIYRDGVFQPIEPVVLSNEQRVRLSFEPADKLSLQAWMQEAEALQASMIQEHGVLPDSTPGIAEDRLRDV